MSLIDDRLAEILVCPADKGDLTQDEENSQLVCQLCGRTYPVEDGIPIMLLKDEETS